MSRTGILVRWSSRCLWSSGSRPPVLAPDGRRANVLIEPRRSTQEVDLVFPYPSFSSAEMWRRREAVAEALSEAEVEHLVVYGANRSGSGVQWLTRWPVTREAVVIHTPGEVDTLLVQFFNHVPNARRMAVEAEVRWAGPRSVTTVVDELRARGAASDARVGVVGALPFQAFQALAAVVGSVVDLNASYTRLRMVKSPEEMEW